MSAIRHCDKESSSADIIPIVFTIVSVEATTGLPLLGFADADPPLCELLMLMKVVLRVSVHHTLLS